MFNGQRGATCHGVIEHSPFLGEEFSEKTHELFRKYYPIEISDCPIEEKTKAMIEWWSKAHEYMIEYGLTKGQILDMIKVANIEVRYFIFFSSLLFVEDFFILIQNNLFFFKKKK